MKLAVISDIHGNRAALAPVLEDIARWGPDELIVNGDLVNRGPCSLACLQMVRERFPACRLLKGNHESFVLACAGPRPPATSPQYDLRRFAHWTAEQLGAGELAAMAAWPDHLELGAPREGAVHITHGTRLGNRDGIHEATTDTELAAKLGSPGELFITSHTHKPLTRTFDGTLVVNVGSVGAPFDGDPRSAYGRFRFDGGRWEAEIVRLPFDRQAAERDFVTSGFLEAGGPMAQMMLAELRQSRPIIGRWMRRYHEAVVAGEISVAEAVARHLEVC